MSSLALYRTYRPGRFSDLVGQDHVTGPLIRALENDRVHHAYLFSGPRGCGKTSSARILARSLNCEKGPTPTPCGECQSCLDLAPNGSGSIDVVELDAATHGLVDDARDLREKAHFAPVAARYKIYIIDEAHQLGPGAANALLKLIEEPPPHLKFIFATTAPDKIIGTIRSRTYHYPFRLIPAKVLQQNLASICEQEGVPIEPAALALVARAGAGSARDAQSILGQLIAGAGSDGVTYDLAVSLLGFTDAALLDEVVDGLTLSPPDSAAVFRALDRVMDSGHEPRRFLTDLLERFRDLIVLRSAPDAVSSGLIDVPDELADRMEKQAAKFNPHDLVRLADVVDEGLTAMKGATPTRLQLELVCARLLLPSADHNELGIQARLDRLERLVRSGQVPPPQPHSQVSTVGEATHVPTAAAEPESVGESAQRPSSPGRPEPPEVPEPNAESTAPTTPPVTTPAPSERSAAGSGKSLGAVRTMWPDVLSRLREIKIAPWSLIAQNAEVAELNDDVLVLAFKQPNLRDTFTRRSDFQDFLHQAIKDVLLIDLRVEAIVDPSATGGQSSVSARPQRSSNPRPAANEPQSPAPTAPEPEHSMDDDDLDDDAVSERDLVARTLGATVIQEIDHDETGAQ